MAVGVDQLRAVTGGIVKIPGDVSERVRNHGGITGRVVRRRGRIAQRVCLRDQVAGNVVAVGGGVAERVGRGFDAGEGRRRLAD